jgi:SAM-dependent methyltransferase
LVLRGLSRASRQSRLFGPISASGSQSFNGRVRRPGKEPVDYDSELQVHNQRLRLAYRIRADDRVLDIGCGAGQTTRDAARRAAAGSAHGVDTSEIMIRRARELAEAEGLSNVTFQEADAATSRFPDEPFDIAISRFGTMFFDEPVVAFTNIARALRPGARMVMMVWQAHQQNEWAVAIDRALTGGPFPPPPPAETLDPFSLADPMATKGILHLAGFGEPEFTDIHEPVFYGADVDAALDFVTGFQSVGEALDLMDLTSASAALDRIRQAMASHQSKDGVWFDSRAWIVTARRQ